VWSEGISGRANRASLDGRTRVLVEGNGVLRSPQYRGGRVRRPRIMVDMACGRFASIRTELPSGAEAFASKGKA
jgi:hypothetical protein